MSATRPAALITGASGGVGRAVAVELARRGFDLALTFRGNRPAAEEAAEAVRAAGSQALLLRLDLTDPEAVEAAVAESVGHFEAIDVLAHCAGAYSDWKSVRDLTPKDWTG